MTWAVQLFVDIRFAEQMNPNWLEPRMEMYFELKLNAVKLLEESFNDVSWAWIKV